MLDNLCAAIFGVSFPAGEQARLAQITRQAALDWSRTQSFLRPHIRGHIADPGIYWRRTGGNTHVVTILREPAWVWDCGVVL